MLPVFEALQRDHGNAGLTGRTKRPGRSREMSKRFCVLAFNEKSTLSLQRSGKANVELSAKGSTEIREFGLGWRGYRCPASLIYPANRSGAASTRTSDECVAVIVCAGRDSRSQTSRR